MEETTDETNAPQSWTPQRVLEVLARIDVPAVREARFLGRCRGMADELVPALRQMLGERSAVARLRAGLLLLYLGEAGGTEGMLAGLRSVDEQVQRDALIALAELPLAPAGDEVAPFPRRTPVPLRRPPVWAALQPLLAEPASRTGLLALQAAFNLHLPAADRFVAALITHPARPVRGRVLTWLAQQAQDYGYGEDALEAAEELLFEPGASPYSNYWVVTALGAWCRSDQPARVRRAATLLARFVHENAGRPGNMLANLVVIALEGLALAGHAEDEERAALEVVLASGVDDWRQDVARRRLEELEDKEQT